MNIAEKYNEFSENLPELTESELYFVMANRLAETLKVKSENSKYEYKDLLDYPYVLEYLRHEPTDSILLLAQTVHTLLFLYHKTEIDSD